MAPRVLPLRSGIWREVRNVESGGMALRLGSKMLRRLMGHGVL